MKHLQIIVGIVIVLSGIYVIINAILKHESILNDNSELYTNRDKLIESSKSLEKVIKTITLSEYNKKYSEKAKKLKIEMEKYLGINCNSYVKIERYSNLVNPDEIIYVIDDLYSLRNQLISE